MILGGVMMLNLLIAMMSHTYDVTQELVREPLRQVIEKTLKILINKTNFKELPMVKWARQVLIIEQNIPLKERIIQQKKYAHVLPSGEKTFMVRWIQTVR